MSTVLPYGEWKSPISSSLATESSVSFSAVCVDGSICKKDSVYWCEARCDEGGRSVVCRADLGAKDYQSLTPEGYNARTTVHEYGNGSFSVHDGVVYFSNFDNQCLYMQTGSDAPVQLTEDKNHRYANGFVCEKNGLLYIVREDHTLAPKEAVNTVVVINPKTKQQNILCSGSDFYSCPKVSPNGKRIAWIQWKHPNMPWDSTELWVAELTDDGDALVEGSATLLVGDGEVNVMQPQWGSDCQLLYISDQTDFWNLYSCDLETKQHKNLCPRQIELGQPAWWFAQDAYTVDRDGQRIVTTYGPEFGVYDLVSGAYRVIDTGYVSHGCVQFASDGNVYCIAGSSTRFKAVLRVNIDSAKVDILKEQKVVTIDPGYFSIPEVITWETTDQEKSHGNLYMPKNKDYVAPEGTLPPLLMKVHGGPTAQCSFDLNLEIQYWTSRGYAILDSNYRGSTGYGKIYRNKLKKNWGIVDVDDCCNGAQYLADQCKVNSDQLCIDGGSAGGYTTLACLAFKNVFKAGASHYGVADVGLLARETHKFESQYMNTLVADYNEENMHIFNERSPIFAIDKFDCPIAFFQGDDDKIVPPNQAVLMYEKIVEKGLPSTLVMFEGEQHGFRKAENIQKALDGQFYFFARVFGIKNPDVKHTVNIVNLD